MEESNGIEQVVIPAYTWDSKLLDKGFTLKDVSNSKCEELGLTQRKVERLPGIEHKSLKAILDQDAQRIDFVNVLKLSDFLGMPVERLARSYTGGSRCFMSCIMFFSISTTSRRVFTIRVERWGCVLDQ